MNIIPGFNRVSANVTCSSIPSDLAYDENTLVMATKGTIESEKFTRLYHKYDNHKTTLLKCEGLAELIENDKKATKVAFIFLKPYLDIFYLDYYQLHLYYFHILPSNSYCIF